MLATILLTYGEINIFIIVFTVYLIFLAIFQQVDLSQKYILRVL